MAKFQKQRAITPEILRYRLLEMLKDILVLNTVNKFDSFDQNYMIKRPYIIEIVFCHQQRAIIHDGI